MKHTDVVVAIDGPAGAGKSSVAKEVAARLGYALLDTGAMYRALTLLALEQGIPLTDEAALARAARDMVCSFGEDDTVHLNGCDVSHEIRLPAVTQAVSPVSAHPAVREVLVERQRQLGQRVPSVVEGRDIGTVVFPQAPVKIFLTASVEHRARRRLRDLQGRGVASKTASEVQSDIARRDAYDSSRAAAPLTVASDAVVIDTSALTLPEVVERVLHICRERSIGQPAVGSRQ